ncbi:hypothetical protein NDI85_19915 [Halomicroarcula sp. S1AR25-4]|uniref:hypothetical protein n=1 Tax=Haloarcula sp. S1AR25-4 TaxID=2950538 RepID=UPI002876BA6F|nr:hypothetical protein [Halomicroarcula sp. S1AR25-4]MDS0280055.1 hypothetical protein [Halomicroarcula sp. S1AR25-4]
MSADHSRLPKRGDPRVEEYTREGMEEDQERVKVVRPVTERQPTLTGDGPEPVTRTVTLADFPAGNAWNVMQALADHFNCTVEER